VAAETVEPEVDDRRADLAAAFEKAEQSAEAPSAEAPATSPVAEAAPEVEPAPAVESAGRTRDDKGRFVSGEAAKQAKPEAQAGVAAPPVAIGQQPAKPPETQSTPPASVLKPPQSWKPGVRELATKLPPEFAPLLEEANRRERDFLINHQKTVEMQRQIDPILRAVQPYQQGLLQRGARVEEVIGNFLRTEQALSSPDPRTRAQVLAQAITTYRVPVDLLAQALDATPAPVQGQPSQSIDPQQIIAQAKEEIRRELEQTRWQAATQNASADIESFVSSKSPEFWTEDIQYSTGVILQAATDRGIAMSLEQAYEQACWADPEIRGVFQQREASKKAATNVQATQRAHAAASSVKSQPGGPTAPPGPEDDSWRAHLEHAWSKAAGQ